MPKFNIKLIWKETYEVDVEARNQDEAEELALKEMEQGNCINSDSYYYDYEVKEI